MPANVYSVRGLFHDLSQWATDFRRDYVTDETNFYNVDG